MEGLDKELLCLNVCVHVSVFLGKIFFPMNEQLASADTFQPCLYVRVTIKNKRLLIARLEHWGEDEFRV